MKGGVQVPVGKLERILVPLEMRYSPFSRTCLDCTAGYQGWGHRNDRSRTNHSCWQSVCGKSFGDYGLAEQPPRQFVLLYTPPSCNNHNFREGELEGELKMAGSIGSTLAPVLEAPPGFTPIHALDAERRTTPFKFGVSVTILGNPRRALPHPAIAQSNDGIT